MQEKNYFDKKYLNAAETQLVKMWLKTIRMIQG